MEKKLLKEIKKYPRPIRIVLATGEDVDIDTVLVVYRPTADFPATVIELKDGGQIMSQNVTVYFDRHPEEGK